MLEGKSEKLEFQKMLSSPHRKNRSEQENVEKGTKINRKNDEKEIKDGVKKAIGDSVKVANEVKINDAKSRARQLRRDN